MGTKVSGVIFSCIISSNIELKECITVEAKVLHHTDVRNSCSSMNSTTHATTFAVLISTRLPGAEHEVNQDIQRSVSVVDV
jgi:hypothetical protein